MIVYKINHRTLKSGSVIWCAVEDALEEVKMHLLEGSKGDKIVIEITEMSRETFESLPEFTGY